MATQIIGNIGGYDVRSAVGPQSNYLSQGFLNGSNPPVRQGEHTQTAFVDAMCFNDIQNVDANKWRFQDVSSGPADAQLTKLSKAAKVYNGDGESYNQVLRDGQPTFEDWASVQVGTVCVSEKTRALNWRHALVSQTAQPVICCAQKLGTFDNYRYSFAGVARTPSVRAYDDGRGPRDDEMFTLTTVGMMEMLNNGNHTIYTGDMVEWTFFDDNDVDKNDYVPLPRRQKMGPRIIVIRTAREGSSRLIGRAMKTAQSGERLDVFVDIAM